MWKSKTSLELVYRYGGSLPGTLIGSYLAFFQSHLEYAAQLWDPHAHSNINKMEALQIFALKEVKHLWDLGYIELYSVYIF